MRKLLDEALAAVRLLSPDDQDEIARIMMTLAGEDAANPIDLTPEEPQATARSKAAAACGEFATEEEVRALWAKHGL